MGVEEEEWEEEEEEESDDDEDITMPGGITNVALLKDPEDNYNVRRLARRLRKEIVRKKEAKVKERVEREAAIERSLLHKEKQAKKLKVVAKKLGDRVVRHKGEWNRDEDCEYLLGKRCTRPFCSHSESQVSPSIAL